MNALILIQGGDELKRENFKEVYTLYFHDVFKFLVALCHDEKIAEELTQETFFRALKSYDQFSWRVQNNELAFSNSETLTIFI